MNALALAGLLTGLSSFSMGMFVLCKDKTRKLNKLWFFLLFLLVSGVQGLMDCFRTNPLAIPPSVAYYLCLWCSLDTDLVLPFRFFLL